MEARYPEVYSNRLQSGSRAWVFTFFTVLTFIEMVVFGLYLPAGFGLLSFIWFLIALVLWTTYSSYRRETAPFELDVWGGYFVGRLNENQLAGMADLVNLVAAAAVYPFVLFVLMFPGMDWNIFGVITIVMIGLVYIPRYVRKKIGTSLTARPYRFKSLGTATAAIWLLLFFGIFMLIMRYPANGNYSFIMLGFWIPFSQRFRYHFTMLGIIRKKQD